MESFIWLPAITITEVPIFLSEFGGVGYVLPSAQDVPKNSWGYAGLEPAAETALARIRGLYEAIARVSKIAAICCTQLYDVEQEVNGLLTYDRQPKFAAEFIRDLNDLLV